MARRRPVETEDAEKPAGKKRGRPAKAKTEHKAEAPAKKRGRPAKVKHEEAPVAKKRGRPAKVKHEEAPAKKRGRPAKVKHEEVKTEAKKRGRPAKAKTEHKETEVKKRGRKPGSTSKASEKHRSAILGRLDGLLKGKRGRKSAEHESHQALFRKAHAKISKMSLEGHSPKSLEEHAEHILSGKRGPRVAKLETKMAKHPSAAKVSKSPIGRKTGKGRGHYVRTPEIRAKLSKALSKAHREGRHGRSKKHSGFTDRMASRRARKAA